MVRVLLRNNPETSSQPSAGLLGYDQKCKLKLISQLSAGILINLSMVRNLF